MKIKNVNKLAIELATALSENRLKLIGNSDLNGVIEGVHVGETNIENTFLSVFGPSTKFFYSASLLCKGNCKFSEVGVGHITLNGASPILHRDEFLYHHSDNQTTRAYGFAPLECKGSGEQILVTSYQPRTMHEVLYTDNCVLTSIDAHTPSATQLDKNSLLLRLDDSIESVRFDQLKDVDELSSAVKDLLCKYTKQIVMKTSKLDVKTAGVKHLIFKGATKPLGKKGEIYYDEEEGTLKFYNGNRWLTFKFI